MKHPDVIPGPIIHPGYICPGCKRPEWHKHATSEDSLMLRRFCRWQIGPLDPEAQAYNPYVQAGYQILTWPLGKFMDQPKIEALEILDARVVTEDPWINRTQEFPYDPFYRAGPPPPHHQWEPTLLLRIRHPIAVRVVPGQMLMYERADEFAKRVIEWENRPL